MELFFSKIVAWRLEETLKIWRLCHDNHQGDQGLGAIWGRKWEAHLVWNTVMQEKHNISMSLLTLSLPSLSAKENSVFAWITSQAFLQRTWVMPEKQNEEALSEWFIFEKQESYLPIRPWDKQYLAYDVFVGEFGRDGLRIRGRNIWLATTDMISKDWEDTSMTGYFFVFYSRKFCLVLFVVVVFSDCAIWITFEIVLDVNIIFRFSNVTVDVPVS